MGLQETHRGAKNRLLGALKGAKPGDAVEYDLAVAIENGICASLQGPGEETWFDMAVVIVCDLRTGSEVCATSAGVPFPSRSVSEWIDGGRAGTVGKRIAQALGGNKQDPHATLTKGAFPRTALLEQAIRLAASRLRLDT